MEETTTNNNASSDNVVVILTKEEEKPIYYPAKLVALPEKWNTFHYIVECVGLPYKTIYFTDHGHEKLSDKKIGDEGYIYKKKIGFGSNSFVHCWTDKVSNK